MSKQPQNPVSHAVFERRGGCLYKWYMTSAAACHDDSPLFAVNITPDVGIQKVELNISHWLEGVFPTRVELCILFFLFLLSCDLERRDFVSQCLADTKKS